MSRVKITADNHCHKPVKGGGPVEDLIAKAAAGSLGDYLAAGGDIDVCSDAGITALHALARAGSGGPSDRAAFVALMDAGINVNAVNNRNETALFRAMLTDVSWMWDRLIDAGASVNVVNSKNLSLVDVAKKRGGKAWALVCSRLIEAETLPSKNRRSSPRL